MDFPARKMRRWGTSATLALAPAGATRLATRELCPPRLLAAGAAGSAGTARIVLPRR